MSDNKNKKTELDNDNEDDVIDDENLDPRSIATEYLKGIAEDGFNTPLNKLADEMQIPETRAQSIINECVKTMLTTYKEADFPKRMLDFYNKYAIDEDGKLTVDDVVILMKLVNRYYDKIKPKDKERILAKMRQLDARRDQREFDPREHMQPVPQIPNQSQPQPQQVTFTDAYTNPPNQPMQPQQQGQGQPQGQGQQGQPPMPMQQYQDPYAQYESEEALMKYLLEMNYNIRDPQRIYYFLQNFKMNKNDWLQNPMKLFVALNTAFPRAAAEATMMQFMDSRAKIPNTAASLYQITGASNYNPIVDPRTYMGQLTQSNPALGAFINQYGGGMGLAGPGTNPNPNPNGQSQDEDEKAFKRLSNIIGMQLMHKMAENQMGGNAGGAPGGAGQGAYSPDLYDMNEVYDNTGRMIKREFIRKAYPMYPPTPTQQPTNDKSNEMLIKFMELMMTSQNSDKQLLMQKVLSGDNQGLSGIVETMLKQMVGGMAQQVDPVQNLNKFLELGEKVAALKQQPQKSIQEKQIEMDYFLAKTEMSNRENEKQREFQRQKAESDDANIRYQDTVKEVGNIIKEAAGPAIELIKNTMGRGLAPGVGQPMYPPGYQPVQQPQQRVVVQQVPQPQQQQQVYAGQVQQQGPQYTPDQVRLIQEEQMRREAEQMAELQRQHEMENKPIEDALAEMPSDQLEDLVRRYEEDSTRLEFTGNKIMAEMAKRKGRGFTPNRNHVSPVVHAIREHEQNNQTYAYPAVQEPSEPVSINPFEDTDLNQNQNPAAAAAVDISDSYNDDEIKESLRVQGLLSEDEGQTRNNLNLDDNESVGVPSSTSVSMPSQEQPQQDEVYEIDENAMVDDSGDTVIE